MNYFLYLISIVLFVTHPSFAALVDPKPQTTLSSQELIKTIQDRDRSWFDKINPLSTHQKDKITAIDNYLKIVGQEKQYTIAGGNVAIIGDHTTQTISPADLEAALASSTVTTTRGKKESASETVAKLLDVAQQIRIEREQATQKLTPYAKTQIVTGGILTLFGIGSAVFSIFALSTDNKDDYAKWSSDTFNTLTALGSTAGGGWMIYQGWCNPGAQAEYAKAAQTELHLIQKFNEFARQEQEEKEKANVQTELKKRKKSKHKIRNHNHNQD